MKTLWLVLSLAFFVPAWTFLGSVWSFQERDSIWPGAEVGFLFGILCGLAFGGSRARWLLWLLGVKDDEEEK